MSMLSIFRKREPEEQKTQSGVPLLPSVEPEYTDFGLRDLDLIRNDRRIGQLDRIVWSMLAFLLNELEDERLGFLDLEAESPLNEEQLEIEGEFARMRASLGLEPRAPRLPAGAVADADSPTEENFKVGIVVEIDSTKVDTIASEVVAAIDASLAS